jgi:hypothetical protein
VYSEDQSYQSNGAVSANGVVRVSVAGAGRSASGSGRLSGNSGAGRWRPSRGMLRHVVSLATRGLLVTAAGQFMASAATDEVKKIRVDITLLAFDRPPCRSSHLSAGATSKLHQRAFTNAVQASANTSGASSGERWPMPGSTWKVACGRKRAKVLRSAGSCST